MNTIAAFGEATIIANKYSAFRVCCCNIFKKIHAKHALAYSHWLIVRMAWQRT